jgi:hypothetical protein
VDASGREVLAVSVAVSMSASEPVRAVVVAMLSVDVEPSNSSHANSKSQPIF